MKRNLLLLLCFGVTVVRGQITGRVHTPGGQAAAFVSVGLLPADDSAVLVTVSTDSLGGYRLRVMTPGRYVVRLSSIGYKVWTSPVFEMGTTQKDLGVVVLQEDQQQLNAAVVRAGPRP